jgi:hypothetical protein
VRNGPTNSVDPSGLFDSGVHARITRLAAAPTGVGINGLLDHIVGYNVHTDLDIYLFDGSMHAQDPSFIDNIVARMSTIKTSCSIQEVMAAIGQSLHILQDFYSHTDWIEGNKMIPVYRYYQDAVEHLPLFDAKLYTDLGEGELIAKAENHQSHYSHTLDLASIAAGHGAAQVGDLIYYTGGYWPFGLGSLHNRYSADDDGEGRDNSHGIAGAFVRAEQVATKSSTEFLNWSASNMQPSVRAKLKR